MKLFNRLFSVSPPVYGEPKKSTRFRERAKQQLEGLILADTFGKQAGHGYNKFPIEKDSIPLGQFKRPLTVTKTIASASTGSDRVLVRGKFSSNGDLSEWKEQPEFFDRTALSNSSPTVQDGDTKSITKSFGSEATTTTACLNEYISDSPSQMDYDNEDDCNGRHSDTCDFCREANLNTSQKGDDSDKLSTVVYFSTLLLRNIKSKKIVQKPIERSVSCQTLIEPVEEEETLSAQKQETKKDTPASPTLSPFRYNGYVELAFL